MTNDEDFGRELRGLAGRVEPRVAVDTSEVIARAHRRRAATWGGGGVALAVGATAIALVGASLPWSGGAQGAVAGGPGATSDLTSTANVSSTSRAATPGPTAAPGEPVAGYPDAPYWFVASQTWQPSGETHVRETYAAHTGTGRTIEDKDLVNSTAPGPASWGQVSVDGVATEMSWDALYRLPTDPQQLRTTLSPNPYADYPDDADGEMAMIRQLLDGSPASPALRQALWSIASGLPRTTVTPGAADSLKRAGTQVTHTALSGDVTTWIYDSVDGAVLERTDGTASGVTSRTTYLDQGPAYSVPR